MEMSLFNLPAESLMSCGVRGALLNNGPYVLPVAVARLHGEDVVINGTIM